MKKKKFFGRVLLLAAGVSLITAALPFSKASALPFGKPDDLAFAKLVWKAAKEQKLAGPGAINGVPYPGAALHGVILESFFSEATINGQTGELIVKRNYGGPGITRTKVANNRAKYLKAITVMFKREKGFDAKNKDWFWVKFAPDGSLAKAPDGSTFVAGRVTGCIQCHSLAGGGEMVYIRALDYLDMR